MKNYSSRISLALLFILILLAGCEHDVITGTQVNADGSLERTIILEESDSVLAINNMMGVNGAGGWNVTMTPTKELEKNSQQYRIAFKKSFTSAEEANGEMDGVADTLFHIHSSFEKKTSWFFTYIEHRDSYRALNRFHAIPLEDYFTQEDFAFIDRLPAEGKPITRADSLYLARLNEKIYEIYGSRTIFDELFSNMLAMLKQYNVEARWQDSLLLRKEAIYQTFMKDDDPGDLNQNDILAVAEKLKIPIPEEGLELIKTKTREMERRLDFISTATSGKYVHTIRMPWKVVSTNADSINNTELYWQPPVIKFLLNDYTMVATSRKPNLWAIGVSALVVLATFGMFFLRRRNPMHG